MTVLAAEVRCDPVADAYREFCGGLHRLLVTVADHDRREGYRTLGVRSEDDYLRRVLDVEWRTARDWVREARLIGARPELGERLAAGELSVDKLRAMAEVVAVESPEAVRPAGPFDDDPPPPDPDPDPEPRPDPDPDADPEPDRGPAPEPPVSLDELLAMLEELSARQAAARAAAARADAARRRERWRTRHLEVRRVDGEGRLVVRDGQLFDDDAAVVHAAFEDYAGRVGINPETGTRDPLPVRFADALRAMADAYLARRERVVGHPLVVFHADAAVAAGDDDAWAAAGADHSPLGADTIRRLICGAKVNVAVDDREGNPLFLGRTQRLASWQQEYMVVWRDGGCRGCGATVGLEIHHLVEWDAQFGSTDVDRLAATCRGCHHLLHDHRWRLGGDPNGEIRLVDPTGEIRARTKPHPRSTRRRPPRAWINDPPDDADDNSPASGDGDGDQTRLW